MDSLDDFRRAVADLMAELGGPITYHHTEPDGTYNPSTGEYTNQETSFNLTGILMDMPLRRNGMQVKGGTMIQDGDKQLFLIPPAGMLEVLNTTAIENIAADRVVAGSTSWRVYNVKTTDPAQTGPIVYEFYLRR
jgi:hypothetical protein